MRIAVIGGKLQGIEALYLARKANIKTILIDRNIHAPAINICDTFVRHQFTMESPVPRLDCGIDLILPALEDVEVLHCLKVWSKKDNIPLAFDLEAFLFTLSKQRSNALFAELRQPAPTPWPACKLPVIVKPDNESGSRGVEVIRDRVALDSYIKDQSDINCIVQEYIEGPSYSIEVLGHPGNYHVYQVTELHMDDHFDCCKVTAPATLSRELEEQFIATAKNLAEAVRLKGLMDVEVILHDNKLKLLEIDARLPSQTPITVFHSTGLNIVEQICNLFTGAAVSSLRTSKQFVCVEHILVQDNSIEICGEHIMSEYGVLELHHSFYGAEEAITSYGAKKETWAATMIFTGSSHEKIIKKKDRCYDSIKKQHSK